MGMGGSGIMEQDANLNFIYLTTGYINIYIKKIKN